MEETEPVSFVDEQEREWTRKLDGNYYCVDDDELAAMNYDQIADLFGPLTTLY